MRLLRPAAEWLICICINPSGGLNKKGANLCAHVTKAIGKKRRRADGIGDAFGRVDKQTKTREMSERIHE